MINGDMNSNLYTSSRAMHSAILGLLLVAPLSPSPFPFPSYLSLMRRRCVTQAIPVPHGVFLGFTRGGTPLFSSRALCP